MGMCVLILVMTATVSAANDVLQPCRVMIVVD